MTGSRTRRRLLRTPCFLLHRVVEDCQIAVAVAAAVGEGWVGRQVGGRVGMPAAGKNGALGSGTGAVRCTDPAEVAGTTVGPQLGIEDIGKMIWPRGGSPRWRNVDPRLEFAVYAATGQGTAARPGNARKAVGYAECIALEVLGVLLRLETAAGGGCYMAMMVLNGFQRWRRRLVVQSLLLPLHLLQLRPHSPGSHSHL